MRPLGAAGWRGKASQAVPDRQREVAYGGQDQSPRGERRGRSR